MGSRRKREVIEQLDAEHYASKSNINNNSICKECPLKLYAKEGDNIIFGIGNIYTNTIMILPSYDVNAKVGYNTLLRILRDCYSKITGKELLEEVYVTRYIKCFNKTEFNLDRIAIKSCYKNLYWEINRIKPSKLISFDKNFDNYIKNNIIKVYHVVSPGVMYYDNNNLKQVFVKQLSEAINDS